MFIIQLITHCSDFLVIQVKWFQLYLFKWAFYFYFLNCKHTLKLESGFPDESPQPKKAYLISKKVSPKHPLKTRTVGDVCAIVVEWIIVPFVYISVTSVTIAITICQR